jgi:hypothetical protein
MIVIPNPAGYPAHMAFEHTGTQMIIPVIAIENGDKTNGNYSWEANVLYLEDGRIFQLDFVSGEYVLKYKNK